MYDIALLEKHDTDGLNGNEINRLYEVLHSSGVEEVYPIEIPALEHESSAMGFISNKAAEKIGYDYKKSGLNAFVASIMDDMEKENEKGEYLFCDIRILLKREI